MTSRYIKDGDAELVLVRASDDPPQNDAAYLKQLSEFSRALNDSGVEYSQRGMAFDSIDALGFPLGEYTLRFGPMAAAAVSAPIAAWLTAKYGRKVRIKFGDVEVEGRSVQELNELLKLVDEHRQRASKADDESSEQSSEDR
jgi:hypothetical protein